MVGTVSGVLGRYQRSIDVQANLYCICCICLSLFVRFVPIDLGALLKQQEKHCDMVVVVSAPAEQQPGVSDVSELIDCF